MEEKKNLCAPIPLSLHQRLRAEQEQRGQTLSDYITDILREHFEGGARTMNPRWYVPPVFLGLHCLLQDSVQAQPFWRSYTIPTLGCMQSSGALLSFSGAALRPVCALSSGIR